MVGKVPNHRLVIGVAAFALAVVVGCNDHSSNLPPPDILNINNSLEPVSPVDLAVEINGSGFLGAPGEVRFTQGSNVAMVTPDAGGWSNTGIVVTVPSTGSEGLFTVPGVVDVSVSTSVAVSDALQLELVTIPVFSGGDLLWATTTALPTALRGHGAVPVPNTSTSAYVVVAGGNDGTNNLTTVLTNTLAEDGQLGASWTSTTALPAPRAYHGIVVAHPANSFVASGSVFVYVVGGQEDETETPGGTDTVYVASVSQVDGSVGPWSLTSALPVSLVGPAVTLYNGDIYVVGGLLADGTPSSAVYSATVSTDGSIGAWAESPNPYPVGVSFATAFGFGGRLYVLGGDEDNSTDPHEQGLEGVSDVRFADASNGAVGTWTSATGLGKRRKKHVTWTAFGQILAAEGVYQGSAGSQELERNVVDSDGTLSSWQSITNSTQRPQADVYNAAGIVSPIQPTNAGPRFLLLGGQMFSDAPPGALTSAVYYNTAP